MKQLWTVTDKVIHTILKNLALVCMVLLLCILVFNVFFRFVPILSFFPNFSMGWFDEIVEMLFAWMVFSTAALLTRCNQHFRVDLIQTKLGNGKAGMLLELVIDITTSVFLAIFIFYSWQLVMGGVQTSPVLRLQKKCFYMCMPVNFSVMLLYTLRNTVAHIKSFMNGQKPELIIEA